MDYGSSASFIYSNYVPIYNEETAQREKRVCKERKAKQPILNPSLTHRLTKEYSVTSHFFDPTHSSPPNDFLLKLQSRIEKFLPANIINGTP